jgi:hypothetical protein
MVTRFALQSGLVCNNSLRMDKGTKDVRGEHVLITG